MHPELDLRPFVAALLRRSRWIAAAALLGALLLPTLALLQPVTSRATVSLLIVTPSGLAPSGRPLDQATLQLLEDTSNQRAALVALTRLPLVEPRAVELLNARAALPADYRPGSLLSRISLRSDGNLLRLSLSDVDSAAAAALVEAWADAYHALADELYRLDQNDVARAQADADAAAAKLTAARQAYDAFVADGALPAAELRRAGLQARFTQRLESELARLSADQARRDQLELAAEDLPLLRERLAAGATLTAADLPDDLRQTLRSAADSPAEAARPLTAADLDLLAQRLTAAQQLLARRITERQAALDAVADGETAAELVAAERQLQQLSATQQQLADDLARAGSLLAVYQQRVAELTANPPAPLIALRNLGTVTSTTTPPAALDLLLRALLGLLVGALAAAILFLLRDAAAAAEAPGRPGE